MTKPDRRTIRCAIYTRKSSDEGLDQAFNSLDAQREACESYISSQRHEGWKLIPANYDDGGLSGGNLERPALQRLLEDIADGKFDLVVVYKIDRLTRSLADFARLVDRFDAADCSFVSVTQSFNTSTSMGRLTLNVLLSFAQFEREVTAERIRDKITASKKKGYWMGGLLPLGYDRHPDPKMQSLVINEAEAETVREIFRLYDKHGCLRQVEQDVIARSYRSKRRTFSDGKVTGSKPLSRGQINFILRNPVYIGRIRHKQESHEGIHDAIVDQDLWDRVQERLDQKSTKKSRHPSRSGALLTGRIFDETGDFLTPTHSQKGSRRYRYYVSGRLLAGSTSTMLPAGGCPAKQLEDAVCEAVFRHINSDVSPSP
jgi:site-specific DNA recombinase